MISKERIVEAATNVKQYTDEGLLRVKDDNAPKFVGFFMRNAEASLQTASILQAVSDEDSLKTVLKVSRDFESYLWVIVSSYYSMFYAATALLASQNSRRPGRSFTRSQEKRSYTSLSRTRSLRSCSNSTRKLRRSVWN